MSLFNKDVICPDPSTFTTSSTTSSTSTPSPSTLSTKSSEMSTLTSTVPSQSADCDFELGYCGYTGKIEKPYLLSWIRADSNESGLVDGSASETKGFFVVGDSLLILLLGFHVVWAFRLFIDISRL